MRRVLGLALIWACVFPAAADQFLVGARGTESDYPFRGC